MTREDALAYLYELSDAVAKSDVMVAAKLRACADHLKDTSHAAPSPSRLARVQQVQFCGQHTVSRETLARMQSSGSFLDYVEREAIRATTAMLKPEHFLVRHDVSSGTGDVKVEALLIVTPPPSHKPLPTVS